MLEQFFDQFKLSKTLRFGLKPQGKTLEYIKDRGILAEDESRAEEKRKVQGLADGYHRDFIDRVLEPLVLNEADLNAYVAAYRGEYDGDEEKMLAYIEPRLKDNEKMKDINEGYVSEIAARCLIDQISTAFVGNKNYKELFSGKMYSDILPKFYADNPEALASLEFFNGFTTYFRGFNENRDHTYNNTGDSGTIGKRLVHDNLPTFIDNDRRLHRIASVIPEDMKTAEKELAVLLDGKSIAEMFDVQGYSDCLTQKAIDRYNQVIGGFSKEDGKKIRGINEYVTMYNQRVENKTDRLPRLTQLKKMILSEKTTLSFRPEPFTEDNEVIEAIRSFDEGFEAIENAIVKPILSLENYDLEGVYLRYSALKNISNKVFDSWRYLDTLLSEKYDADLDKPEKTRNTKTYKKKKESFFKKKDLCYSVADLDAIPGVDGKISQYLMGAAGFHQITIDEARRGMQKHLRERGENDRALKRDSGAKAAFKAYLDSVTELKRFISTFMVKRADKDDVFYSDIEPGFRALGEITPLYNKTRNYLSGKLYTKEKIKLNFGSSILLEGWSESVEKNKLGTILIKDGRYYLGIIAKGQGDLFAKVPDAKTDDVYKKMRYNLISGANKSLPHVIFSKKGMEAFKPDAEIMRIYKGGTFKKSNKDFSLEDCHKLIDFYKDCITKIPAWGCYNFEFSDTSSYQDISGFYREVETGGYSLEFRDIDREVIDKLVDNGQLYLFEIWNKDFSEHAHGKPDLSTIYWKAVFDERNKNELVYKLNGGAEVFYRKASIKEHDIIRHKAGDTVKAKNPLTKNQTRTLKYDIIKDRRYTLDHFQLNVPITLNASAPDFSYINTDARFAIKEAADPHVIGVSRGENSLIYITVLDSKGNVVEERSLNMIGNTDYAELLARREAARDTERKNWETVEGIKQVKDGYLGQVVRVLADLMLKYDAVIVIEDLNSKFKQARQKIEKAVYQQLEEKLITKLNFVVNKDAGEGEIGEPFLAYQLTGTFDNFERIGKQTGFIFYVSPWNTTAIDSKTGFANHFYFGDIKTVAAMKNFWHSFDNISYDSETDAYRFDFDYNYFVDDDRAKLLEGTKTRWSVFSHGERVSYDRTDKGFEKNVVNLTEEIDGLLKAYGIDPFIDNLKDDICAVGDKTFHEKLLRAFKLMVNLRNEGNIISPVMDLSTGEFFRASVDANGAYNIARKGLILVDRIKATDDEDLSKPFKVIKDKKTKEVIRTEGIDMAVTANNWLEYVQK